MNHGSGATSHRFYQAIMLVTVATFLFYLGYRVLYTLNTEALWLSLLFLYAEVHGFLFLLLYFFQIWHPIRRTPPEAPAGLKVDVFITTYNEEVELVRKTVVAALAIRYPHETYLLDDGARPAMEQMARELGCHYISRQLNTHGKAGNLNNALGKTSGEFVAVFDADHVPMPEFLDRTLGYFQEPKLAIIQTPQQFYNCDSFTFTLNQGKHRLWNDQQVFFHLMMPGRDYWEAAYFVGTNAVLRRSALEGVGGFATGTVTEDLRTSLHLAHKGWKCWYHHETLAWGLAAKDVENYHKQQMRWCQGNIADLFEEPLWRSPSLTWPQKLCFFAILFTWLSGFYKLVYFTMPTLILFTGLYPVVNFGWEFLACYAVWMTVLVVGYKVTSRGYGSLVEEERFNMLNFFVLIKGVIRAFWDKRRKFQVTAKGRAEVGRLEGVWPQAILAFVSCGAGLWGCLLVGYDLSVDGIGTGLVSFWAWVNGGLALSSLRRVAVGSSYQRKLYRVPGEMPVYVVVGKDRVPGVVQNFHEEGALVSLARPLAKGIDRVKLLLVLDGRQIHLEANVVHRAANGLTYGLFFGKSEAREKDLLVFYEMHRAIPQYFSEFEHPTTTIGRWHEHRLRRREHREERALPVALPNGELAVTHDISPHGMALLVDHPMEEGARLNCNLLTPEGRIPVEAYIRHGRHDRPDGRYLYGVELKPLSLEAGYRLNTLCEQEAG